MLALDTRAGRQKALVMATTLLLVEDSITTQKAVAAAFEGDALDIVTSNDATEALRKLQVLLPDIILVDASMHDIDGFQLCTVIRQMARVADVPVLLLTSSFAAYDQEKGREVGVTAHLAKPFDPQTLRALVQQLLTDYGASKESLDSTLAALTEIPSWQVDDLSAEALPGPHASAATAASAKGQRAETVPPLSATVPEATSLQGLYEALGHHLVDLLRDGVQHRLDQIVDDVMPQLIQAVQEEVNVRLPALLETVLQREIDKLKQAVEHDAPQGDPSGGPSGTAQSL